MDNSTDMQKDFSGKHITVTSHFDAPVDTVWDYFTNADKLAKWWAPKPYKAITRNMEFSEGGKWLYYMLSPEGDKHWCLAEFKSIQPGKGYEALDAFCDEQGRINQEFPRMQWKNEFRQENGRTTVINHIQFPTEEDMKKILEMGFEQGYKMGLSQLQDVLPH